VFERFELISGVEFVLQGSCVKNSSHCLHIIAVAGLTPTKQENTQREEQGDEQEEFKSGPRGCSAMAHSHALSLIHMAH
jgi:hypothetical protein